MDLGGTLSSYHKLQDRTSAVLVNKTKIPEICTWIPFEESTKNMEEINRGQKKSITKKSSLIATNLGRKTKNDRGLQKCNIFTFPHLGYYFHHR